MRVRRGSWNVLLLKFVFPLKAPPPPRTKQCRECAVFSFFFFFFFPIKEGEASSQMFLLLLCVCTVPAKFPSKPQRLCLSHSTSTRLFEELKNCELLTNQCPLLGTVDATSSVRRGEGKKRESGLKKELVMEEQVSQCLVSKWLFI